jgi:hypothetical protein
MRRVSALAVIGSFAVAGCTTTTGLPLPVLDQLIAFENPRACRFEEPFGALFFSLAPWDEDRLHNVPAGPIKLPGIATPIVPRLAPAQENELRASAALRGRWHGLHLREVGLRFVPESDVYSRFLAFEESPFQVAAVLRRLGMPLDESSHEGRFEESDWIDGIEIPVEYHFWLEFGAGGTELHCYEAV